MKKIVFYRLLWLLTIISAIPAQAVDIAVKTLDLEVELPGPGDGKLAFKPKIISAKSAYGDLMASGDIMLLNISWDGSFEKAKNDNLFQAGFTYRAKIDLVFTHKTKKYFANYVNQNGNYTAKDFVLTVNGIPTTLQQSNGIAPSCVFNYTVAGNIDSSISDEGAQRFYDQIKKRRSTPYLFEKTYADSLLFKNNKSGLITVTGDKRITDVTKDLGLSLYNVDKVLFESNINENYLTVNYLKASIWAIIVSAHNIEEIWVGNDTDATAFLTYIYLEMVPKVNPDYTYSQTYNNSSRGISTQRATIFVPEAQLKEVKEYLNNNRIHPSYSIKAYRGKVRDAIAKNDTYNICSKHVYTATIPAADRVYEYGTCDHDIKYYYSCTLCGKCEKNPKHVFRKLNKDGSIVAVDPKKVYGHNYELYIADDDHYIGTNLAGQHIYWKGCIWCKHSTGYNNRHPRPTDVDPASTLAETKAFWSREAKRLEDIAKVSSEEKWGYGMYTMPAKSTAKMSKDMQSGVNFALCVHLVDEALLGNDYTLTATRQQMLSIAVRLAEELIGKSVPKASSNSYSDANDDYALKAATMHLTTGFADSKLNPDTKVTRQEMATVIRRVLIYVEENSDLAYSEYDSKLNKYTDKGQLKDWAVEPVAFMNALGLFDGTTSTTLAPNLPCSIELALNVAYNSTYAHTFGWYQTNWTDPVHGITAFTPSLEEVEILDHSYNERVWVTGPGIGTNFRARPIIDPYTGKEAYINQESYHPVRAKGGDPVQITKQNRQAEREKIQKSRESKGEGKANTKPTKTKRTVTKKKTISKGLNTLKKAL